jgi:hypothetical protein
MGSGGNRPPLDGSVRSFLVKKKKKKREFSFLSVRSFFLFSPGGHTTAVSPPFSLRGRALGSLHPTQEKKGSGGRTGGDRERAADSWRDEPVTLYKIKHFLSSFLLRLFLRLRKELFFSSFLAAESIHRVSFYSVYTHQ